MGKVISLSEAKKRRKFATPRVLVDVENDRFIFPPDAPTDTFDYRAIQEYEQQQKLLPKPTEPHDDTTPPSAA